MSEEHNNETNGRSGSTAETTDSGTTGAAPAAKEKTDPIAVAVGVAYEARKEQLATYANSGRFPSFAVEELKAKLEEVLKEHAEWEKANGGGGE